MQGTPTFSSLRGDWGIQLLRPPLQFANPDVEEIGTMEARGALAIAAISLMVLWLSYLEFQASLCPCPPAQRNAKDPRTAIKRGVWPLMSLPRHRQPRRLESQGPCPKV